MSSELRRPVPSDTRSRTRSRSRGRGGERARLRGDLGVASIVFMVTAAASPLAVVGGPVPLGIAGGNGTGFPATYVVAGVVLLFFAVGFTAMTPHVRSAGAFSSYVDRGLGRGAGLGAGFAALLSYVTLEAGVFGLLGPGLAALPAGGRVLGAPWWVYAASALVVVAFVGYRDVELSGKVLGVGLVSEVLVVVVFDAVVLVTGGDSGLSSGIVSPDRIMSGAPGVGVLFAVLGFIGFEATAVFRDEARDPGRTIPRATYLSLALIGTFYALSSWALITAVGDAHAVGTATDHGGTMLADATRHHLGAVGGYLVHVLFVTSLFAGILSFHAIVARYVFALAGRGALPAWLGAAHPRHGSPHRASNATAAVVAVLLAVSVAAGLDPADQVYTWLASFASVGVVLLYAITSAAVVVFFARHREHRTGAWPNACAPALGLLGLVAFLVLILDNLTTLVGGSTALAVGVPALLVASLLLGPVVARRGAGAGP
ncbi:APC family permease [Streptomyces sp. NPDC002225]|uniref:APC family permease n=1 Tax=Streptomyces sp. NPDC002225 TaxID=3154413 RepID=UPI003323BB62